MRKKTAYPGCDKKFKVTVSIDGFSVWDDDFLISIRDWYGRVKRTVTRSSCFFDEDRNCYFTLEGLGRGSYYAVFRCGLKDEDYDKGYRVFADAQHLVSVAVADPCGCSCGCGHDVHYEEVFTSSIDGDDYLVDSNGEFILTSEGRKIKFKKNVKPITPTTNMPPVELNMTGDEFKMLIEGINPNGKIDTIPEALRAMEGFSDDKTIKEDEQEQVAESNDIDEIFT